MPSLVVGSSGDQIIPLGDFYIGVGGYSTDEATVTQVVPITGTLRNLYVHSSVNIGGFGGLEVLTFLLYKNGSLTDMSCIIGVPFGQTGVSCSDTFHSVAVSAGDTISLKILNTSSKSPAISWAVQTG